MIVQDAFSLTLALALQRSDRVNGVFRAVFFLPVLIAPVAAGYIWSAIVAPAGPLNRAIGLVVPGFDSAWLGARLQRVGHHGLHRRLEVERVDDVGLHRRTQRDPTARHRIRDG
ncbi:sugar ABC transporter permease [Streptomyces melanosporofaciens]|uniref:sugar ABC transporter permease n=1 Tax=Streptomyces melanosporofaciens TaxID=67327 RepID=UPI0014308198|nr:sugar ABC transporter permease [Streptomyces melanosporofaciens]